MVNLEKFVPYTDEDIVELKKIRKLTAKMIFSILGFIAVVSIFIFFFFSELFFKIVSLIPIVFASLIMAILNQKFKKDLKSGQKRILTGKLNDKKIEIIRESSGEHTTNPRTNYYFFVGTEKIKLDAVSYELFSIEDVLEIHFSTPHLNILRIIKIAGK
jgi:hypothetical protein